MALQDLTPQLRTRLSRVERAVGIFVLIATLILLGGFVYYIRHMAERKGWFLTKLPYHTFLESASGLKVGDPVTILGFPAGEITEVTAMPPDHWENPVYIAFYIKDPYYGYIWEDSKTKVVSDFPIGRHIEVVPGGTSGRTNLHPSYQIEKGVPVGVWDDHNGRYNTYTNGHKGYSLYADEAMAVSDRLDLVAKRVEAALPNILNLTNLIAGVLTNATRTVTNVDQTVTDLRPIVSNVNLTLLSLRPAVTNLEVITGNLRNPKGSLGEWLIPTNLNGQLQTTLASVTNTLGTVNTTIYHTDTNLTLIVSDLSRTLDSLANLTSNLNSQVQANTNIVKEISDAIVHTDELVQGLKKHWLLRSAFKTNAPPVKKTNAPPAKATSEKKK